MYVCSPTHEYDYIAAHNYTVIQIWTKMNCVAIYTDVLKEELKAV